MPQNRTILDWEGKLKPSQKLNLVSQEDNFGCFSHFKMVSLVPIYFSKRSRLSSSLKEASLESSLYMKGPVLPPVERRPS